MRVAFYLDSIKKDIDYKNPGGLNPGIGGTQFLICSMSYCLSQRDNGIEVILFAPYGTDYSPDMDVMKVESIEECIRCSFERKVDYLVLRGPYLKRETLKSITKYNVKIILWEHNFEDYNIERIVNKCPQIVGNICVSLEQRDLLLDSILYKKSKVINNGINLEEYEVKVNEKNKTVCYVGSLLPYSGYDSFLKAWEIVQLKRDDIELCIIGGNDLYNMDKLKNVYSKRSQRKLKKLENRVLRNEKGDLKKNIRMTGVLGGYDKIDTMRKASIGVANLRTEGETFGLVVVEFQALGIPVVSFNYRGVRNTVINNSSGDLVKSPKELAESILSLLDNEKKRTEYGIYGKRFVRQRFEINKIAKEWETYFCDLKADEEEIYRERFKYDSKMAILINYRLKNVFPFLPSHLLYKRVLHVFKRVFQKMEII